MNDPYSQSRRAARIRRVVEDVMARRAEGEPVSADGDLEAIVLKCLANERERRYQSAPELAEDIRRRLDRRPVLARPPSAMYQIRAFARRNRAIVLGAAAVLTTLVLGLISTTVSLVEASSGRNAAETARDAARRSETVAQARLLESQRLAYIASIAAADSALSAQDAATAKTRLAAAPEELRGWEWSHLMSRADRSLVTLPDQAFEALASPDGASIALFRRDGSLALLDAATLQQRWSVKVPITQRNDGDWRGQVSCFSRDGALISALYGPEIFAFRADSGELAARYTLDGYWGEVHTAFSPDGKRLGVTDLAATLRIYDLITGASLVEHGAIPGFGLDYTPDGKSLIVFNPAGTTVLDPQTARLRRTLPVFDAPPGDRGGLRLSPDASEILSASGFDLLIIRLSDGQIRRTLRGHTQRITNFHYSPDGSRIVSSSWDRTVRIWDAASGRELHTLLGHSGETRNASFTCGGSRIVSSSGDGAVKIWDADPEHDHAVLEHGSVVRQVAFGPDSRRLVSLSEAGAPAKIWAADPWRSESTPSVDRAPGARTTLSADQRFMVAAEPDNSVRAFDLPSGRPLWRSPGQQMNIKALAVSPDDATVAALSVDSVARLWSASGQAIDPPRRLEGSADSIAFTPRADRLVFSLVKPGIGVCDVASGQVRTAIDPQSPPSCETIFVVASPDGSTIASCHAGGVVILWDAKTLEPIRRLTGMNPVAWCAAFNPDGSRLAVGSQDRLARVWDPRTGQQLLVLHGHTGTIASIAWSPDGRRLATGSYDGTVRIWEAPPPRQ